MKSFINIKFVTLLLLGLGVNYLSAQNIHGQVIDSITFEPLPYVNVKIKGTLIGTLTNTNGRFKIRLSDAKIEKDSLEISFLSYNKKLISLSSHKDSILIKLASTAFTLSEVIVSPQPPEEYIKEAIKRIPENFANQPYNTRIYFREVIKLNGKYLNFTEAIMEAYNLPFTGNPNDSSRLQLIAMRHINEENEAVKSVKLKRKKKKQDEIDSIIIKAAKDMSKQGGPYMLLDSSLVRRWYKYETKQVLGDYHFRFKSVLPYQDRKLLDISYGDKKKERNDKEHGSVYLEENSLAIESFTYGYNTVPVAINAAMFVFGYTINDLSIQVKTTTQPTDSGYIDDFAILRANIDMEKLKLFKSNIPIKFEMEAVMIVLDYTIPATKLCTDGVILKRGEALYQQGEPNPNHPIWQKYKGVILPEGKGF